MLDVNSEREGNAEALRTTQRFLGLATLLTIGMAAVAIAIATRRYTQRHYDVGALLGCLGLKQQNIFRIYLWQLLLLALAGSALACLIGWAVHAAVVALLAEIMAIHLPAPSVQPLALGFTTGLLMLLGLRYPVTAAAQRRGTVAGNTSRSGASAAGVLAELRLGFVSLGRFVGAVAQWRGAEFDRGGCCPGVLWGDGRADLFVA